MRVTSHLTANKLFQLYNRTQTYSQKLYEHNTSLALDIASLQFTESVKERYRIMEPCAFAPKQRNLISSFIFFSIFSKSMTYSYASLTVYVYGFAKAESNKDQLVSMQLLKACKNKGNRRGKTTIVKEILLLKTIATKFQHKSFIWHFIILFVAISRWNDVFNDDIAISTEPSRHYKPIFEFCLWWIDFCFVLHRIEK